MQYRWNRADGKANQVKELEDLSIEADTSLIAALGLSQCLPDLARLEIIEKYRRKSTTVLTKKNAAELLEAPSGCGIRSRRPKNADGRGRDAEGRGRWEMMGKEKKGSEGGVTF